MERYLKFSKELYQLFIDFKQAFHLIRQDDLWHILVHYRISSAIIDVIKNMYEKVRSITALVKGLTEEFSTSTSVGYLLSPTLFCLFVYSVLALVPDNMGIVMGGYLFDLLAYADDINCLNEKIANAVQTLSKKQLVALD